MIMAWDDSAVVKVIMKMIVNSQKERKRPKKRWIDVIKCDRKNIKPVWIYVGHQNLYRTRLDQPHILGMENEEE